MGRHKSSGGTPKQQTPQQKRPRVSSSGKEEDPEVMIDTMLGALAEPDTMKRFVTSLCAIPEMKSKLVEHLLPTLDDQVKQILDPFKSTVDDLQERLKASNERYTELESKHDDLEQYTRRQNIRISGFPEQEGENTDDIVVNFAKTALKLDVTQADIDRSHRVGKRHPGRPSRDIIIRFVSYKTKVKFMKSRKLAREYNGQNNTRHFIFEDLTRNRSNLAYQARKLKRDGVVKDTWTFDGKIFIKAHDDVVTMCSSVSTLPRPNQPM